MFKRFKTPNWLIQHEWTNSGYALNNLEEIATLRKRLSKFKTANPVVSIAIPVWNEEKNIIRTLSSFANMHLPFPTELIVVNNNSTDKTKEILENLGVKYITETKQGIAHARLAGLKASKGIYHLCADGDSLYPPNWVQSLVKPLMQNEKISCVYGLYSFIPSHSLSRFNLGLYEFVAECLFHIKKIKREFLNVRGASFGFRRDQGLQVKGFEMPVTRIFDNDEKNFVIFGEDGRMGRKLSEIGKLKMISNYEARIWTSSRRLMKDGSLSQAFAKRIKQEIFKLAEYCFGPAKVKFTTDQLETKHL